MSTQIKKEFLRGKVVAITGAGRGIGLATAKRLSRDGAYVAIGDIDSDCVGAAAAEAGVDGYELDVTSTESFTRFLDRVESDLGPLDMLINNAGIMPVGTFVDFEERLIRRTVDIDMLAVMIGSQLAAKRMLPRRSGRILNVASVASRVPCVGMSIYNGAKFGVAGFTEALDMELAPHGVRVSTVMPGFTNTGLISGIDTSTRGTKAHAPEDIADLVARSLRNYKLHAMPRPLRISHTFNVLPYGLKKFIAKRSGVDRIFLQTDKVLRDEYQRRIAGDVPSTGYSDERHETDAADGANVLDRG